MILFSLSCNRESRVDGRQDRLDRFREVLPTEIRNAFDEVMDREDCAAVGLLLENARVVNHSLDSSLDSITNAELIGSFSNEDIVCYFYYYFAYAIETGSVGEP